MESVLLTPYMRSRVWMAMCYQNDYRDPFSGDEWLRVKSAFIVGQKIFFSREAAEGWVRQTKGKSQIVKVDYSELYKFYNKQ